MRTMLIASMLCTGVVSAQSISPSFGVPHWSEDLGMGTPTSALIRSGDCRMLLVGDSISNRNQDGRTLVDLSSMYWGMIRTWKPDRWVGLGIPTNNKWPNIQARFAGNPYATMVTRQLRRDDPSSRIFSHGYERIASSPTVDILFNLGDLPADETIVRNRFMIGDAWKTPPGRGGSDLVSPIAGAHGRLNPRWLDGPLQADFIYARTPETVRSVRVESRRVGEIGTTSEPFDISGPLAIVALPAPPVPAGIGMPEFRILGGEEGYDEHARSDHLIWLTTRVRRRDITGFSLDATAVGGARVREFLKDGLYMDDNRLREYLAATGNPNLFYIQLGANDLEFRPGWKPQVIELIDRLDRLSSENGMTPRFLLVSPYGTPESIQQSDAIVSAMVYESIARNGTLRVPEDRIAYFGLAAALGGPMDPDDLKDRIHPNRRGSELINSMVWDRITWCRADFTGSSNPNDPGFGVPDGIIDALDFFFFLDLFASDDLDADLTGSGSPGEAGFGDPDGVIDAEDFFYYLEQFATGCEPI